MADSTAGQSCERAEGVLAELRGLARSPVNRHVETWAAAGRPVVGYLCRYVPVEPILAAGALPLRLRGEPGGDSSLGDAFMSARVCTYVRHVASLALGGGLDVLDGQISTNSCDHVRRLHDVFVKKTRIGFHGFVSVPRAVREDLYPYYREQIRRLYAGLAAHFGVETGDDALRDAIRAVNGVRTRLARLDALRLDDEPKLSGAEALTACVTAQTTPPDVAIGLLDRLLAALERREGLASGRARLLLAGAELDEPEYVAALESQGALVVADRLCWGTRGLGPPIDPDADDPLDAIARSRFFGPSCARMIGDFPRRWDDLHDTARAARADGIVYARLMFCDPTGGEVHNLAGRAKRDDALPILTLSREYGVVPAGQLRTRVQAFVERLEIARARQAAGAPAGTPGTGGTP